MKLSVAVLSLFLAASMAMPAPSNQIRQNVQADNALGLLANPAGLMKTLKNSVHFADNKPATPEGPTTAGK
ncbi:hypothetical protein F9C07_2231338 [Aspergillus flavus]|uniref:Uncharacterized protein n=3 Tax=Aspergillus subgen. Circumdati TaxID=2720871 RepID=A0A7U2MMJ0_ASPFN|nr:uncharacterized protein G4B84_005384 [Aspergillus flavus NRRL3357]KOC13759.1 hypothetical protein AFLA70_67g003411 [Aspergillus flavus AF70]OOO14817.1 hypothetical protein OAory_01034120 [Aspergillus oryzae]QRD86481.1 hypothetical protein F9C07_2231338 [Aspergillus flavus]KAF7620492.1 hypothetical protein AFLA_005798 [Aspergillus flavus NRRL3357]QMW30049.1 hypothetical protein G4B84_005384 [Aspergillus flavus NRRL3357]